MGMLGLVNAEKWQTAEATPFDLGLQGGSKTFRVGVGSKHER